MFSKVYYKETIELLSECFKDLIIQEYLGGQKNSADNYIDLIIGEVVSIFIKKK